MAVTYAPTPKHFQGPEPWAGGCRGALADDPAPRVTLELQTPPGGRRAARAGSPSWRNRWRRRQDSNLRALAGQWFSRPPPSASRPLLRACVLAPLATARCRSRSQVSSHDDAFFNIPGFGLLVGVILGALVSDSTAAHNASGVSRVAQTAVTPPRDGM